MHIILSVAEVSLDLCHRFGEVGPSLSQVTMAGRRPNVRGSSLSSLDSGTGISLSSLSSHPAINRLHSVATIEEISSSSSSASRITNAIQLLQGK